MKKKIWIVSCKMTFYINSNHYSVFICKTNNIIVTNIKTSLYKHNPTMQPIAAKHHIKIAVVRLCISLASDLNIKPEHKKDIPVTICPIILVESPVTVPAICVNIKDPKRTSVIVLIPTSPRSFLSFPNIQPITKRIPTLIRNSIFF